MKLTVYLYIIIGMVEVYAQLASDQLLIHITKPLLMPALIGFYLSQAHSPLTAIDRLMVFAFVCSWVGDMALMLGHSGELYFLAGLVAFMITHLLYIAAFSMVAYGSTVPILRRRVWIISPLAAYFAGLLAVIWPAVAIYMRLPVAMYTAVLATMVIFALNRYKRVNDSSFALVFGGALLFMLSDSLIAVHRFACHGTFFIADIGIMALYIAAQYLIARGMLRNDNINTA